MAPAKREKENLENPSPLRSLSSFKSEIPGSTIHQRHTGTTDATSKKTILDWMDGILNSAHFLLTVLLFVFVHCILLTAEVIIAFDVQRNFEGTEAPSTSIGNKDDALSALSATCLAILAVFLFEGVLRLFCIGTQIKSHKMDVLDVFIVAVTFLLDLLFHVTIVNNENPWTRTVGFLILLRLWRFYGIYWDKVYKMKQDVAYDLEMAKYGRRQAEAQADLLQTQCDSQLKEIAHLRNVLQQHSLDPDSPMPDFVPTDSPFHLGLPGYSRTISLDRAETFRDEQRLFQVRDSESAILNSKEQEEFASQGEPSNRHSPSISEQQAEPQDRSGDEEEAERSEEEEAEEALEEVGVRDAENGEVSKRNAENGEITPRFQNNETNNELHSKNDKEGMSSYYGDDLSEASTSKAGFDNLGYEDDSYLEAEKDRRKDGGGAGNGTFRGEVLSYGADEEEQLRLQLEELQALSNEILETGRCVGSSGDDATGEEDNDVSHLTENVDGVPTTSL